MNEGGRCYSEPVEREKDGSSKKIVQYTDDCDVPEQFISTGKFYKFLSDCIPDKK